MLVPLVPAKVPHIPGCSLEMATQHQANMTQTYASARCFACRRRDRPFTLSCETALVPPAVCFASSTSYHKGGESATTDITPPPSLPIKTPVATFFDYTDRAPPGPDGCVAPHGPSPTHRGTTCRPTPWTSRTEVIWRLRLQAVQVQERLHLLLGLQDIAARRDNVAVTHALFRASCPHPVPHTPSRWQHEMLPRANWATSPFPSGENLYDQSIA